LVVRLQLLPLRLRRAEQAELKLESVAVHRRLADDLRQPARSLPAHEVHLEETESRMHVARGEEQVVVGLCRDVGGAVPLEHHADRLPETCEMKHAVGDLRVGGHGPCAGGRVERGAERRQSWRRKEGDVKHGRGHDERSHQVE